MGGKSKRPQAKSANKIPDPVVPQSSNDLHPLFCFQYLCKGFRIEELSKDQQAQLALSLGIIARYSWQDCTLASKHSQIGTELLGVECIKRDKVPEFSEVSKYTVFRYTGANHPMIGVRTGNVFHALWIEQEFGDVYDH
jgi:hypothetical protein